MNEIWKPVVGFEGAYEVSDLGRVRSLDRVVSYVVKGKVLSPGHSSNGYPTVVIGAGNSRTVHSLVMEAFVGPRPKGQVVMHADGVRRNTSLSNLQYGTPEANSADMIRHGTRQRGSDYANAKLTEKTAKAIRLLRGVFSQSQLAWVFGVSASAIQGVHDGRTWSHA